MPSYLSPLWMGGLILVFWYALRWHKLFPISRRDLHGMWKKSHVVPITSFSKDFLQVWVGPIAILWNFESETFSK